MRYNDTLVLWGSFRTRYTKRKKHARENGEEKIDEKERVIILHWKNPLYVSGVRYNDVFVVWDNIELNLKKKKYDLFLEYKEVKIRIKKRDNSTLDKILFMSQ